MNHNQYRFTDYKYLSNKKRILFVGKIIAGMGKGFPFVILKTPDDTGLVSQVYPTYQSPPAILT